MKHISVLLTLIVLTLLGAGCNDHAVVDPLTAK